MTLNTEDGSKVTDVKPCKILGYWQAANSSMELQINKTSGIVAKNVRDLMPILRHTNVETRRVVIQSKCISILS